MPNAAYVVCRTPFRSIWSGRDEPNVAYEVVFGERSAAEDYARQLDREYKRSKNPVEPNPFLDHRLEELSSLPEFALRDWLLDADIPPPGVAVRPTSKQLAGLSLEDKEAAIEAAERRVWVEWWDRVMIGKTLTAEQLARVWEAFNRHSLYGVQAVDAPEPIPSRTNSGRVYAVLQNQWVYNDSFYDESTALLRVFRNREQAEAECLRLNIDVIPTEDGPDESYQFTVVVLKYNPAEE